jgi:hypothetical protein
MTAVSGARRVAVLGTLVVVAGSVGAAASAACGDFGEATAAPDAAIEASGSGAEGGVSDAGADALVVLCPDGAFCDAFDDGVPLPRAWEPVKKAGGTSVSLVAGAGVGDSGALVVVHSATDAGEVHTGFLRSVRGKNGPATYRVVLAFSARIQPGTPNFNIGPRFFTEHGSVDHAISVDFHGGQVSLGIYANDCDASCNLPTFNAPIDQAWHRYVMTVDVRPSDFGVIDLSMDGTSVISTKLRFSMSTPSAYGAVLGLSFANPPAAGKLSFDDFAFTLTPQ